MALLRTLRIRNLVIIEDLTAEFGPGLNLLTGETGAGKSILVDALSLVAGARADRSLVRAGADGATVEALFDIHGDAAVYEWVIRRGAGDPQDGQLVIRRELSTAGAGRVLINGSPCTVGLLRELAEHLLELHRQHEQRSLLVAERHVELLDRFGGHLEIVSRVGQAYRAVREAREAVARLGHLAQERAGRLERLQRTMQEIDTVGPQPGELNELERERRVLQNAGRVIELLDQVVTLSYEGEPAAAELAASSAGKAEELAQLDPALEPLAQRLRSAAVELQDAGASFRDYREGADFDPGRLERLEARRAALEQLCLRYGADEAGLLERRDQAAAELRSLDTVDAQLADAQRTVELAEDAYIEASDGLTRRRRGAARKLQAEVRDQLDSLALGQARFGVRFSDAAGEPVSGSGGRSRPLGPGGAERAEFHLSANPGEPSGPLGQVASGGELSRAMLALHVVEGNKEQNSRRVLVFDEIDAGVGGGVADAVGARLARLARTTQVLCVTHLPQIAAYADLHHSVTKRVHGGRTRAGISSLSDGERVEELARMLGGRRPTSASRRHASELLSAAGRTVRSQPRSRV